MTSLWRQPEFLTLWAAHTVSSLGSQFTTIALPLTAVLTLGANSWDMGLLSAAVRMPWLAFGLVAGVVVDRLPRRGVMVAADIGRALALTFVPAAAVLGQLRLEHLYVVAFVVGSLTVLFDVADLALLPTLVADKRQLVEANSKLQLSRSAALTAGPVIGGWLVHALTAPLAIALDSLSFLVSALLLRGIRAPEPRARASGPPRLLWAEVGDGLRAVLGDPLLRAIAISGALINLSEGALFSVYLLYLSRELMFAPSAIGFLLAGLGVGFLFGSFVTGLLAERFGLGRTLVASALVLGVSPLLIPLAASAAQLAIPLLLGANVLIGLGGTIYGVSVVSLRQTVTPVHLQGRVSASQRTMTFGAAALGSLIGGAIGQTFGLHAALVGAGFGFFLAFVLIAQSPLRTLRDQPASLL